MALLPTGWIKMPGDNDETKRFAWSHVKSIFYNKAANVLLKDKLDEMDKIIDEKIAKALMSNVQVNDQSKIPTSALAYAMQQSITKNGQDIAKLNGDLRNVDAVVKGSLLDYAKNVNTFENVNTGDPTTDIPDSARYCIAHIMCRANSWFISVEGRDNRLYMNYNNGTDWTGWNSTALKSDLDNKIQCGLSSIGEISPGESTSEITFPHSFPTAPKSVVGNIRYVGYGDSLSMQIAGITTTGFSVYIHNTSSRKVSIAIYWIACLNYYLAQ